MTSTTTIQLPNIETCSYSNPMYKANAAAAFKDLSVSTTGFLPTHTWHYASSTCRSTSTVLVYNSLDNTYATTSKVIVTNFASSTQATTTTQGTTTPIATDIDLAIASILAIQLAFIIGIMLLWVYRVHDKYDKRENDY